MVKKQNKKRITKKFKKFILNLFLILLIINNNNPKISIIGGIYFKGKKIFPINAINEIAVIPNMKSSFFNDEKSLITIFLSEEKPKITRLIIAKLKYVSNIIFNASPFTIFLYFSEPSLIQHLTKFLLSKYFFKYPSFF